MWPSKKLYPETTFTPNLIKRRFTILFFVALLIGCARKVLEAPPLSISNSPLTAQLNSKKPAGFPALRKAFTDRNPGYDLAFEHRVQSVDESDFNRVAFVQTGGGTITLSSGQQSKFSIGDIVMINPGVSIQMDSLASLVIFTVPEDLPQEIPVMVRPDWDMNITDTPGGCATETNAYRRILLTWMDKVGPYLFHSINAHRVRIMDSFTHYHPKKGGFDEFYLVQMVLPEARLITSNHVEKIENPVSVTKEDAGDILETQHLQVGDLIYLPRGMVHRGIGGVLAQVITVPGFVPGSEIGVDHHLKTINERLKLDSPTVVPYNRIAASSAVIK